MALGEKDCIQGYEGLLEGWSWMWVYLEVGGSVGGLVVDVGIIIYGYEGLLEG